MEDIVAREEDGFIRVNDLAKAVGYRDFPNLRRTRAFREVLAKVAASKKVDPSELVKTARGAAGSFVDPEVSRQVIDLFCPRSDDEPEQTAPFPAAAAASAASAAAAAPPDGMRARTAAWCEAQSVLLDSLLKRKAVLEEFGLCDSGTQQFFADAVSNQKRRLIGGPPTALYAGITDAPRTLAIMSADSGAVSGAVAIEKGPSPVPTGQVAFHGPLVATITYESLGVTDVLFRFAGVQLTSGQSCAIGARVKQAYEAKYHEPPTTAPTRVNNHLVDVCVYRRDDWRMILDEFAEYNKDLVRAHKAPIEAKHPIAPLI